MMAIVMNYFPPYIRRTQQFFLSVQDVLSGKVIIHNLKSLMRNPINSGAIFYETTWRQFAEATKLCYCDFKMFVNLQCCICFISPFGRLQN